MTWFDADTPVNSYELSLRARVREAGLQLTDEPTAINVNNLSAYNGQLTSDPSQDSIFDGGKFAGGFGPTQIQLLDYWTLRARSAQLFNENLYARGLIRRLVTNEINTGLAPEACPDEQILGLAEDSLADWTEEVENRFGLWADCAWACDWKQESTFGELQRVARQEALIEGDVLVVLRQSPATRLPMVQLLRGDVVRTPYGQTNSVRAGNTVLHGVERDVSKRVVGYWIQQEDGAFKRLPAYGEKSGRRIAWLVFGTDKRLDDVRGQPLLSIVLQSLKEIDRYRDSAQRKAVVNSFLAMFIEKSNDKAGTLPMTGGAVRRGEGVVQTPEGTRRFKTASMIPGLVVEELQQGEKLVSKGGEGTDTNFGTFESVIIQAVAWANEVPPEILTLAFSNNYSASQAAINEFKIYLNKVWDKWGSEFCTPIYVEYLVSDVLRGKIAADGLLEAWRSLALFDVLAAWTAVDWYGSIKVSTDVLKQVKGSDMLVAGGYSTRAREARVTTGTKFSKNVKRLRRENEQLAEALEPLAPVQTQVDGGASGAGNPFNALNDALDELADNVEQLRAEK